MHKLETAIRFDLDGNSFVRDKLCLRPDILVEQTFLYDTNYYLISCILQKTTITFLHRKKMFLNAYFKHWLLK